MSLTPRKQVKISTLGRHHQADLIIHNGEYEPVMEPGFMIGPILRDFHVIKYCVSGKGTLLCGGRLFFIEAGQSYVVFPGIVVEETADTEDPWRHIWVTVDGSKATMMFMKSGVSISRPVYPWSHNEQVLSKICTIVEECGELHQGSELYRIASAYLLMDELVRAGGQEAELSSSANVKERYIWEAMRYMEGNCCCSIRISDVASHVGLNRSYFFSLFKRHTNISPQEYLIRLRIKKACELLTYPQSTVASVASSVGYESSAFFRHFKRITGMSASEYKKDLLEQIQMKTERC